MGDRTRNSGAAKPVKAVSHDMSAGGGAPGRVTMVLDRSAGLLPELSFAAVLGEKCTGKYFGGHPVPNCPVHAGKERGESKSGLVAE